MTESQRKALEAIPEQGEYFMNATAMTRAVGSNHGAIVVMWRDVYNVGKNENGAMAVEVYDNTTLPSGIAMAVGMLKLVEPKQIIPDIGMRIADDSFYVMHPEGTP
jgi:hypothetical protein